MGVSFLTIFQNMIDKTFTIKKLTFLNKHLEYISIRSDKLQFYLNLSILNLNE